MSAGAAEAGSSRLAALIARSAPTPAPGPAADDQEHCGLCGVPVPAEHRHVVDLARRELHCACRACSVLFDHAGAGGRHYRLVPDTCVAVEALAEDPMAWTALGLPVELAFFVRDGATGRVTAFYPSPAGPTESELELRSWERVEASAPAVAAMAPDVEALLLDRRGAQPRAFVVGVDECYRLVALMRLHWRGLGGGDEVRREIGRFFAALADRAGRA